jgi:hypothetical protein
VSEGNDDFEQADAAANAALEYARSLRPGIARSLALRKLEGCGALPTDYGHPSLLLAVDGLKGEDPPAGRAGAEGEGKVKDWKWAQDPKVLLWIIGRPSFPDLGLFAKAGLINPPFRGRALSAKHAI